MFFVHKLKNKQKFFVKFAFFHSKCRFFPATLHFYVIEDVFSKENPCIFTRKTKKDVRKIRPSNMQLRVQYELYSRLPQEFPKRPRNTRCSDPVSSRTRITAFPDPAP